jgi:hypothetical protein
MESEEKQDVLRERLECSKKENMNKENVDSEDILCISPPRQRAINKIATKPILSSSQTSNTAPATNGLHISLKDHIKLQRQSLVSGDFPSHPSTSFVDQASIHVSSDFHSILEMREMP